MKFFFLSLFILMPLFFFSQNEKQEIKSYLVQNQGKLGLTSNDISDWIVESKATSKATKISNFYIKQRYQGKEIFQSLTNVWVKNGIIIDFKNKFVSNLQF